jgi:hypothetical protein
VTHWQHAHCPLSFYPGEGNGFSGAQATPHECVQRTHPITFSKVKMHHSCPVRQSQRCEQMQSFLRRANESYAPLTRAAFICIEASQLSCNKLHLWLRNGHDAAKKIQVDAD